jgi:hypothetical protein
LLLEVLCGMKKNQLLILILAFSFFDLSAQVPQIQTYRTQAQQLVMTNEDSLNAGLSTKKTVVSGYGSAFFQRDFNAGQSTVTLERAVLFVGHQFSNMIAFFSELEIENAKVAAGESGTGEIAMEQAFLKFNLNSRQYIIAGLFTPRIGLLNENHLPVNFNGVERPQVEQLIIPATWRELGVGFCGTANRLPLNYSIALINGLNSEKFEHGTGIREGRAEGSSALTNNIAVTGSLQYFFQDFKFQVSEYYGGTVGLSHHGADSLGLNSGAFGTPLNLLEADVQYYKNGISAKALGALINYPDADKVNAAYGNNIASKMVGAYAELAYNWLYPSKKKAQFVTFLRYEYLNMNQMIPKNGIYDGTEQQSNLIAGLSYLPIPNVTIKADVRLLHTGSQNPDLTSNPAPNTSPYQQNNQFLNVGIGYSF